VKLEYEVLMFVLIDFIELNLSKENYIYKNIQKQINKFKSNGFFRYDLSNPVIVKIHAYKNRKLQVYETRKLNLIQKTVFEQVKMNIEKIKKRFCNFIAKLRNYVKVTLFA